MEPFIDRFNKNCIRNLYKIIRNKCSNKCLALRTPGYLMLLWISLVRGHLWIIYFASHVKSIATSPTKDGVRS